jgi:type IV pilus assembly protein PilA
MLMKLRNRKGFTLVELMIVVAIIGILAAIAIPNFLNFRLKAKTSEAKSNLGAIRLTEVAYVSEWNYYVGNQEYTPILDRTNVPDKTLWVTTTRFSLLGFAPEGKVFFSYQLLGTPYPSELSGYTSNASADLDNDASVSVFTMNNTTTEIVHSGGTF